MLSGKTGRTLAWIYLKLQKERGKPYDAVTVNVKLGPVAA